MSRARFKEKSFVVRPVVAAHSDDKAQPHVAEHPHRFGVLLAAQPGAIVVGFGPLTVAHADKGKLPQGLAQRMNTGPTNMDCATGPAFPGDGGRYRLRTGRCWHRDTGRDCRPVLRPSWRREELQRLAGCRRARRQDGVSTPAESPDRTRPGARQAFAAGTPASQPDAPSRGRWAGRYEAAGLHPRMNLGRPLPATGAVMATEECLDLLRRYRLQRLAGRKCPKQRQRDGPVGIREQGQELGEIGLQTRGQLIAEYGAGAHQLGTVPGEGTQLLGDLRVRPQRAVLRPIRAQEGRQDPGIPQIRLGARDTKPLPMPVDRLRVDRVDRELLVEQRAHERAMGRLERDKDILRILNAGPDQGHKTLQPLRGVVDRPRGQRGPSVVHQTIDMLGIGPINPDQQHWLPPPDNILRAPRAASPQPSIRTAFETASPYRWSDAAPLPGRDSLSQAVTPRGGS